jgi:hypothetical protein
MNMNLNELAAEIHAANSRWWHDLETGERLDRNKGEMLMLILSELAEAMEGERKNLRDDHLPERMMAEVELADVLIRIYDFAGGFGYPLYIATDVCLPLGNRANSLLHICRDICNVADELERESPYHDEAVGYALSIAIADVYQYAEDCGYDVDSAMVEKRAYNVTRADHQREARLAAGGKKF